MAFNLQKVLRALLFSSSQALSIKDVQDIFARFHEQAPVAVENDEEAPPLTVPSDAVATDASADDIVENADASDDTPVEREPEPDPDPEAPSLKPAELRSEPSTEEKPQDGEPQPPADDAAEVVVQFPEDSDEELYKGVPSLITAAQIREAMDAIAVELQEANDIYILVEGPAGYRLMTHPRFARWIRIMRDEPPPVRLSQSALETLAIVAYRQPVTRSEIESIRGVSADAGLNKLIERELVYITGRADLPGRPLQYGTTDKFLEFVGVKSLVELPASDVLSPRQIDAWLQNSAKVTPPSDADMGLPLEEGEGESPNLAEVSVGDHSTPPFAAVAASAEEVAPLPDPTDQPDNPDSEEPEKSE
ncbi:segregation and condensation protein B [Ereboglobus sp. PH5-5]|uniref:SMC-Scp complex subunit ScpB n=1 Tax=Ereboglobus sp. PH5-5 TaxID=2940529 RepID=UPI00240768DA|nr:SMC-Scp complex subunit ScpB [Ereboglobus sp. PH5-5]MDF9833729.1 segregation and condensation protein B [Ereboglobus sp. PH5-5]